MQANIQAEILNIGDELLNGQVLNTNASAIATMLNRIGVKVAEILTIGDDAQAIEQSFAEGLKKYQLLIVTGGLGTTKDDITKKSICNYFHVGLKDNLQMKQHIKEVVKALNRKVSDSVFTQSMLPENCKVILNPYGIAPGMWMEQGNAVLISIPGVPMEMESMLDEIEQKVVAHFHIASTIDMHFKTYGIAESALSDLLDDYENQLPSYIKLAYLPQMGIVNLRLTGHHADAKMLAKEMNCRREKLLEIAGEYVFSEENKPLSLLIGDALKAKGQTMATAESCTGGLIVHQMTSNPGSSLYVKGGVVAYSNEIKTKVLHVDEQILTTVGAVSEQTVLSMAANVLKLYNVDYSLSVSGIAGPDGGTAEKPVGTVWIAVANKEKAEAKCFHFGRGRKNVVERTVQTALYLIYKLIQES